MFKTRNNQLPLNQVHYVGQVSVTLNLLDGNRIVKRTAKELAALQNGIEREGKILVPLYVVWVKECCAHYICDGQHREYIGRLLKIPIPFVVYEVMETLEEAESRARELNTSRVGEWTRDDYLRANTVRGEGSYKDLDEFCKRHDVSTTTAYALNTGKQLRGRNAIDDFNMGRLSITVNGRGEKAAIILRELLPRVTASEGTLAKCCRDFVDCEELSPDRLLENAKAVKRRKARVALSNADVQLMIENIYNRSGSPQPARSLMERVAASRTGGAQ